MVLVVFNLKRFYNHHIGIINDDKKLKSELASIKMMFLTGFMRSVIGSKILN